MKKFLLPLILLCSACSFVVAQEEKHETLVAKGLKWAKDYLDKSAVEGLDSNYVCLPKYGFLVSVSVDFAGINIDMEGRGIRNFGDFNVNMKSIVEGQSSVYLAYRGLQLSYTRNLFNTFNSDLSLSWLDRAWGIEYRHHSTDGLHGNIYVPALDKPFEVQKGNINVNTTLIDAYLILNARKFSYIAATFPSIIQKRSAGSVLIAGNYNSSTFVNVDPSFVEKLDDVKEIDIEQAAVGIGYGYNFAINRGQILLHLSAIPMIIIHNNNLVNWIDTGEDDDGSVVQTPYAQKMESSHKILLTGTVRGSANFNISDRLVLRLDGKMDKIRFRTNSGLTVNSLDWLCSLMLGVRF